MNTAQKEALEKIHQLIREHFDCGIVFVEIEDDKGKDEREFGWHGGISRAIGLCRVAQYRMDCAIQEWWDKNEL